MEDVQRYRPYSDRTRTHRRCPTTIAEDIVNTVNGLQVYQQELAKNTAEQQELRGEFDCRHRALQGTEAEETARGSAT